MSKKKKIRKRKGLPYIYEGVVVGKILIPAMESPDAVVK